MKFDGTVVAITGATRGLGRVLVQAFLQQGCRVAAIARNPSSDLSTQADCMFVQADVTELRSLEQAGERIKCRWNHVDVWINNAGLGKKLPFLDSDAAEWAEVFNVNFWGAVNGCRVGLRSLLGDGRRGCLINIASLAGLMACRDHSAYCTAKAAIIALTRSLAVDYAAHKIRVNAIAPGPLDTEGFRAAGGDPQQRSRSIPTGTMVAPWEIAEACIFLAKPLTSLTGQTIVIDGGSAAIGCYAGPERRPKRPK